MTIKRALFCLMFLTSLQMMGQDAGKVVGKISLSGNVPAESVSVALKGTRYSAVTNENGQYEIRNVKPATYTISIHAVGIHPVEAQITVNAKQTVTKNFILSDEKTML